MTSISISQLKANPTAAILAAEDYPVQMQNRSKTVGYLVGKNLFEKMIEYLEDLEDKRTIKTVDLGDKADFEDFAKSLGI